MKRPDSILWGLSGIPALLLIFVPLAALTTRANLGTMLTVWQSPEAHQAIFLSLRTTLAAILIVGIIGFPVAQFIAGQKNWLSRTVDVVSDLPIVLPPAAAGIALLAAFGRNGWPGGILSDWGVQITFTSTAVVIAQVFVALPFFVRSAVEGLRRVDPDTLDAGAIDGASQVQLAVRVHLPQCRNAIVAGLLLGWARAAGEFGATLMFAGSFIGRTQTLPLAIYAGFESDLDVAVSLSVILLVIAVAVLVLAKWIARRDLGS